jgi:hypothetical protein
VPLATSFLASRLNLQRASWAVRGYRHVHSGLPKGRRRLIMPTWDDSKRHSSIRRHKLDFVGVEAIWDGFTVTREDIREQYGERRFVTFGMLRGEVVILVYT